MKGRLIIIASIVFFLNVAAAFLLFANLRNAVVSGGRGFSPGLMYMCIIFIILFSFALFSFIVLVRHPAARQNAGVQRTHDMSGQDQNIQKQEQTEAEEDAEEIEKIAMSCFPQRALQTDSDYTLNQFAEEMLSSIAKTFPIVQGLLYIRGQAEDTFMLVGDYAYYGDTKPTGFRLGETLPGQVAKNKELCNISNVPENYITIHSGLGQGSPRHLLLLPLIYEEETIGVVELASFKNFDKRWEKIFTFFSIEAGKVLVRISQRNQK